MTDELTVTAADEHHVGPVRLLFQATDANIKYFASFAKRSNDWGVIQCYRDGERRKCLSCPTTSHCAHFVNIGGGLTLAEDPRHMNVSAVMGERPV